MSLKGSHCYTDNLTPRSWLLYCWSGEAEAVYTLSSEKVRRFGSHKYEARLVETLC